MKKIRIYINDEYVYTTCQHSTIKEAIQSLKKQKSVLVHSIPDYTITLKDSDKITGKIVKF